MTRAAAIGVVTVVVGLSCAPHRPTFAIRHTEQRGQLAQNGLRFVVMPDPTTDLVEVAVRYQTGSADDPDGKAGLAHLVEHLMFDLRPEGEPLAISAYLERVAVSWNAYTSRDSTHYLALGTARNVDSLLQIEAMRLFYGCKTISDDELAREREVVRNEARQRGDVPEVQIERVLSRTLYPSGHPYARSIGGDDAEIAGLTLADACGFIDRHYVPENAVVIVTGGVDVAATVALIEKWFGKLDRKAAAPHAAVAPVVLTGQRTTIDLDIDRPIVTVAWSLPPVRTTTDEMLRYAAIGQLAGAVGLARTYETAIRGGFFELGGRGAPILVLVLELDDLDDVDDALAFTWKAARRGHARYEAHEETFSRWKTRYIMGLERLEARANEVADLIQFRPDIEFAGTRPYVFAELDAIDRLDMGAIDRDARLEVDPAAAQITVFRPTRTARGQRQAAFDFRPPPHDLGSPDLDPAEARRRIELPARIDRLAGATRFELGNGLQVVLLPVEDPQLPIISVELGIGAGDAASPEHPLVPMATAEFAQPPDKFLLELSRAGIELGCTTTPDHTICQAQSVSIYLRETLVGLERTLKLGEYDQREIERWQALVGDVAQRRRQIEDNEFDRQELAAVFGADHVYTRTGVRRPGAERGFGRDELYAFRDHHYGASNTTLVVAGAFDPEQAESIIRDAFGHWPRGQADPPVAPTPLARTTPVFVGVVRESGPQMQLAISYPSPAGIDGQAAARMVVTELLSAATSDVRSKLGATYGVRVRREERRGPTRYQLETAVDSARAGEALVALRDAIAALRRGDDFAVRFARARRKVLGRLLAESTASDALARRLGTIARFGLRPNYYQQLVTQVAALSTGQVRTLIETELAETGEVVVAMSDRESLTAAFATAKITDVTLVEPDVSKVK